MTTISSSTTLTTAYQVTGDTTGTLVFKTGATPTTAVTIDGSQNVGIGTSSPSYKLQVKGAVDNASTSIGISDSNGRTLLLESPFASGVSYIGNYATSVPFGFKINGSEVARFDSSGNLSVGSTSNNGRISSYITTDGGTSLFSRLTGGTNQPYLQVKHTESGGVNTIDGNSATGTYALAFSTGGSERARIDSSGNLLVGCTSTPGASVKGFAVIPTASTCLGRWATNTTSADALLDFYNPNGKIGQISVSGSTTSFTSLSDYRLKENIQPMQNALATVAQLKPCTYTWKADGSDGQGFIAHELQAVVPDCVTGEKDAVDADGNPVYQGIDTSFLVATLTAAIQELNTKVEAQAAEIAALKGQA